MRRGTLRAAAVRHARGLAVVIAVASVAGFVAYMLLWTSAGSVDSPRASDLLYGACQVLPYGLVGAVLVDRRPDLPFGWLLGLAAMSLVLMVAMTEPAVLVFQRGGSGELAAWGLAFGVLAFVPTALQGVINVRFPSGQPTGRWGRILDRLLVCGIVVAVIGGVLGDSATRAVVPQAIRVVDRAPAIAAVGNALTIAVPVVIGLGVVAGIGIIARCIRARGLLRKQLIWRAAGVGFALVLFPLAVTEQLPQWASDLDPLVFVLTLVVPILRYDLWAIDTLIRRSAAATMTSPRSVVENMVRVSAEMLRLPYLAVQRAGQILAVSGERVGPVEEWTLVHDGTPVGILLAAPRPGHQVIEEQDRQVLATLAQLIAGAVSAQALTLDLQDARQHLVSAREEERRRLRRDLHDGLGPLLTGLGLNLDAAGASLSSDPVKAATYLSHAKDASSQVISSLREVVHGLRPPALDDLGFVGALTLQVNRIAGDAGLAVDLRVPSTSLTLPAAVEVAAFQTIGEAVTNVVRHSDATRIQISVTATPDQLTVTVDDDGGGTADWQPGIGLRSMRERAEELGGSLRVTQRDEREPGAGHLPDGVRCRDGGGVGPGDRRPPARPPGPAGGLRGNRGRRGDRGGGQRRRCGAALRRASS